MSTTNSQKITTPYKIITFFAFFTATLLWSCSHRTQFETLQSSKKSPLGTKAYLFFLEGKTKDALVLYRKAAEHARSYDNQFDIALYTFNAGRCFYELNLPDSAISCFIDA